MPYGSNAELPDGVKARYDAACQTVWREAYMESAAEGHDEGTCIQYANAAANRCAGRTEKHLLIPIAKAEPKRQIAFGVVLEPRDEHNPDLQQDWYSPRDVEDAAYGFMKRVAAGDGWGDVMHDEVTKAGYPVESYLAPVDFMLGDEFVPKGSWVMGMHYPDPGIWKRIESGELTAFSVGGSGSRG